jgi:hypothetical protein
MTNEEIRKFILENLPKMNLNMSEYQIEKFIINDQLTTYRKIRQIFLELRLRYESLKDMEFDIDIKNLEIKKKERELSNIDDEIEKEIIKLEILKMKRQLFSLQESHKNMMFEIEVFENAFNQFLEHEGIEKIKDYIENGEKYEPEFWINKFVRNAALELASTGSINHGLLESISNMELEEQKKVYENTYNQYLMFKQYLNMVHRIEADKIEKNILAGK